MLATLTGAGLSAAAGFNAYIPLLIVALTARFTHLIELPSQYAWVQSWWVIGIAAVLLVVEIVLDKIPAVDTVNDAIGTAIRPTVGGLIFVATAAAGTVESHYYERYPWVGVLAGVILALITHGTKMGLRPVINASTAGVGTPVVSAAEDGTSALLSVVAIAVPVLVIVLLVALVVLIVWVVRRARALGRRVRRRSPDVRA
ncbi:DUF4126 domain-containing protein [Acidipropionibacterium timonense]|uniref:DUF4126 domain-containing protein n=1 Tax=Acidipropionibacterium timonense TaxID=2161818 RepID=UPI0010314F74|nr:DUF4126 domain-containing protein [Acidipropionibacterium timonense]